MFLCFCSICKGQVFEPIYTNYNSENGLPSNETYHVLCDQKGRVWFSSDNGVGYYSKGSFKYLNTDDGLTDRTVFKMYEDYKGRIWFSTSNHRLSYFENDSIYPYKFNDTIDKYIPLALINSGLVIDKKDNVHLSYKAGGYYKLNSKGSIISTTLKPSSKAQKGVMIIDEDVLIFNMTYRKIKNSQFEIQYSFFDSDISNIGGSFKTTTSQLSKNNIPYSIKIGENRIALITDQGIIVSSNKELLKIINNESGFIFINKINGLLWGGTYYNGCYSFEIEKGFKEEHHLLFGKSTSSIEQDVEGGYWFSSLEKGLFYTPTLDIMSIHTNLESNITSSEIIDNVLYIAYHNGDILCFDFETNKSILKKNNTGGFRPIFSIKKIMNSDTILAIGSEIFIYKNNDRKINFGEHHLMHAKHFEQSSQISFKIGWGIIIAESNNGKEKEIEYNFRVNNSIIYKDSLFLGTSSGLYQLVNNKLIHKYINTLGEKKIIGLSVYNEVLFISTSNQLFKIQNGKINALSLPFDCVKIVAIKASKNNEIFIYTDLGLVKYNLESFSCKILNENYCLPISGVKKILEHDDKIYLQTISSIIEINQNCFNNIKQETYIESILINDKQVPVSSHYELTYDRNQLEINFFQGGISQKYALYNYQLIGEDKNMISTSLNIVRYSSLQSGEYFFVLTGSNDGVNFSDPVQVSFVLLPPFWFTWWFICIEIIIFIFIVYLLFLWRIKRAYKKNFLKNELIELKSQALRAQMNPHFTFNALNSIQSLIVQNKIDEASIYLSDFSKLMRLSLEASIKHEISLNDELAIIEKYLILEKLRFKDRLNWKINVSAAVNSDIICVPSMFLQPLVENAIIHGLLKENNEGKIEIVVNYRDNNQLEIKLYNSGAKLAVEEMASESFGNGLSIIFQRLKGIDKKNSIELNSVNINEMVTCATVILNKTSKNDDLYYY
jgi:ligand-binding sensor domain-containing protein